jgi:hypothetical protein
LEPRRLERLSRHIPVASLMLAGGLALLVASTVFTILAQSPVNTVP